VAIAASITFAVAGQISTPVPSPRMKGMMGSSGTRGFPSEKVIVEPVVGGVIFS